MNTFIIKRHTNNLDKAKFYIQQFPDNSLIIKKLVLSDYDYSRVGILRKIFKGSKLWEQAISIKASTLLDILDIVKKLKI